jgi:hypothetical protein
MLHVVALAIWAAVLITLGIVPWVVCWQKGRKTLFWLSFLGLVLPLFGVLHIVGAIRLARPESHWATKHYDQEKMARAKARFTKRAATPVGTRFSLADSPAAGWAPTKTGS